MYVLYVAISSAVNITYMMCIRVVTILFTLPVFILWFIVAATDGLTQRDIRKYEGGIESSFVYHKVKPFILPAIALSCGIYLTSPFSINPALFFLLPQLILFFATYWTCATFKKFL
jgi:integrating conjugative element membrane protein (TIGR03747 family)